MARDAAGIGQLDVIEASVTRVARNAFGKLEIELGNGQAWAQLDSTRLALAPGTAVRIRRAALGSYLLAPQAGGPGIRVRRER